MTEPATTTTAPDSPAPVAQPNGGAAPAPERSPSDFEARVRTDPDFALAEMKKHQRHVADLTRRIKPLESL